MRSRLLAVLLLVLVLCPVAVSFAAGDLTLTVIDVGQGDSILIDFPNGKHALVDAGDATTGGPAVHQFLKDHGVTCLDLVVLTHPDKDHIAGMSEALKDVQILAVWDACDALDSRYRPPYDALLAGKSVTPEAPTVGWVYPMGGPGISFRVLGPTEFHNKDTNNDSLVLRLTYKAVTFLLPGDMEKKERDLIANGQPWPHDTVLKVAHHGSYNGTNCAFAQQVSPDYSVISYALANRHSHPHVEAVMALSRTTTRIFGTGANGNVTFTTNGTSIAYRVERAGPVAVQTDRESIQCPTATDQTSVAGVTVEGTYLAAPGGTAYHRATCSKLDDIAAPVHFNTKGEAEDAGYKPCALCKP